MSEISQADREAMGDEAVDLLTPMEWDVFLCVYGLGDKPPMRVSEIVVELGLSDSTVRRALKRARTKYAAAGEAISVEEGARAVFSRTS